MEIDEEHKSEDTTALVERSKRTGEGDWEDEIQDEAFFQYDGENDINQRSRVEE